MEGLLPVIIALVLSAIFSIQKKKASPEESSSPQKESPWEDLVRELQSREDPPMPSSTSALPPVQPAEKVVPKVVPSEQILEEIPVAEPVSLESPVVAEKPLSPSLDQTDVWSKNGGVSGERNSVTLKPVTSALDLTLLPSEDVFRTLTLQEVKAVSDSAAVASESEGTVEDSPFVAGFDPRMAVLYSEILRPKYQD